MKTNTTGVEPTPAYTHGGAKADRISVHQELERSVMSCLLWEDEHYEDGEVVAKRIAKLVPKCKPAFVALLAITARTSMKLRHVPLYLVALLAKTDCDRGLVRKTLAEVVQRADELAEFLAMYWKNGRKPVPHCVRLGLSDALRKFNEYNLAKYDRNEKVKLRDVLRVCHPKPSNKVQANLWKRVVKRELKVPNTWEVALSAGKDKAKVFTKLIKDGELGALALLRNLRNMEQSGVSEKLVREALDTADYSRVLPFRFVSAAQHAPRYEGALEKAMFKSLENFPRLDGKTVLVVDVSGSMWSGISSKSDLTRVDAAAALAMLIREISEEPYIYVTAGSDSSRVHKTGLLAPRRGFALRDSINQSLRQMGGGGIFLRQCLDYIKEREKNVERLIVFTDEQDCDQKLNPSTAPAFGESNYLINVASAKNGIGYKKFTHVDGFSEAIVQWIIANESLN